MKVKKSIVIISCLIAILMLSMAIFAQGKKNSRPGNDKAKTEANLDQKDTKIQIPVYFYEFSQPNFIISLIKIEHDENGAGRISFQKKDFDESITEKLELSNETIEKLKGFWTELNFLESNEIYQTEDKDYSHLGNMKFKMSKDKKERVAEFNWTENKTAKALADEYRKIGNQFVWIFDMGVARDNQPLESPKIMKRFDKLLTRNEIADPNQMMPFLKSVRDDERFPLITRNHATRIIKKIEKIKKQDKTTKPLN